MKSKHVKMAVIAACLAGLGGVAQAGGWSNQEQAGGYELIGSSDPMLNTPEMVGTAYSVDVSKPGSNYDVFAAYGGAPIAASAGTEPSGYGGSWLNEEQAGGYRFIGSND